MQLGTRFLFAVVSNVGGSESVAFDIEELQSTSGPSKTHVSIDAATMRAFACVGMSSLLYSEIVSMPRVSSSFIHTRPTDPITPSTAIRISPF